MREIENKFSSLQSREKYIVIATQPKIQGDHRPI